MSDGDRAQRPAVSVEAQRPSSASWVLVAIAWTLVGVPLLWGVYQTLEKAKVLFG